MPELAATQSVDGLAPCGEFRLSGVRGAQESHAHARPVGEARPAARHRFRIFVNDFGQLVPGEVQHDRVSTSGSSRSLGQKGAVFPRSPFQRDVLKDRRDDVAVLDGRPNANRAQQHADGEHRGRTEAQSP